MPFPREISSLPLTASQQKSLFEKGFQIVGEIQDYDTKLKIEGLTKAPITKTAAQLFEEEIKSREVESFLGKLDEILSGVLRIGSVTELVGLPGSGRTQLCLHLSVSAQIINNTLSGKTIYICTNMDFCITRLREIIDNYRKKVSIFKNLNETEILKNIHYINIMSVHELSQCLDYLNEFAELQENITLVIIDSITYPFRLCERNEKSSLLYSTINQLRHLANLHDFTVVLTNDMTTIVGPNGSEVVPSLRDTFYHIINNRILLSQNDYIFQAELLKCSTKFLAKCNYTFLDDVT